MSIDTQQRTYPPAWRGRRHGDGVRGLHACVEACEHASCEYDRRTDGRLYVGADRRTFERRS